VNEPEAPRSIPIRSFRKVIDDYDPRIYAIDRWRIPYPHGIRWRSVLYGLVAAGSLVVASWLPLVEQLIEPIPGLVRLVVLPAALGWALASYEIDGRRPHYALASLARHRLAPRAIAGLRPVPAIESELSPVETVAIAPSGAESVYRAGRVKGPATLILGYPARFELEGVPRGARGRAPEEQAAVAKRLRISAPDGQLRPLLTRRVVEIGEGAEAVIQ
jgi:hypothetical protein